MKKIVMILSLFIGVKTYTQVNLAGSDGLDSQVQEFLEVIHSYQGPPLQDLPLDIGRNAMENMQKDSTLIYDKVTFTKVSFKEQGKQVNTVIVKPKKTKKLLPVLLYFHGGGWVFNSFETHKRLMRDLALKANVAIVFVEYSRAPEVKYPIANEEGYAATLFISKYGKQYGLDTNRIIVGGDSVGGNMATVVAMMAEQKGTPKLLGQVLLYPVTDTNLNTKSYEQFSKGHYLTRATMKWFWNVYVPEKKLYSLGTVAPLKATLEELKNLPKTLLITAECDVLRDEGETYARKLRMAGVPVVSTRYGGTIHDFIVLNSLRETVASKEAVAQIATFLKKNFSKK
ncbi:alpha/beta hydrolase [Tenacibaculum sp. 1_MG-2023]|uniref:alpha/beta hydrolase n=1 Tax=Tenacibaculum sp. 1_MG-2023 TaxID=3062653 RepID=UPI0026E3F7F8|nr:alpha/beta hydrolase [Tenacibaculum sp. 1_MG-2023]MDO6674112.1 alpha/beta hydrolase [Tenacibaculum sp. 1_MG-2023]